MKRTAIAIAVGALSFGLSQGLLAQDEEKKLNDQQQMTQEGEQLDQNSDGQGTEVRVEGEAADVSVEQAEPNVTVEQTGEVDVEVETAENVDAEMVDPDAENLSQQDQDKASGNHVAAGNDLTKRNVSEIEGYTVFSQEDDEEIGDVKRVVRDLQNNDIYVVITKGGFLGFGKDEMGFKLDDLQVRNDDELVVRSSNDGAPGDYSSDQYEDLDDNQSLSDVMQRN